MAHGMAYTTEGNHAYTAPTGWEEIEGVELFKFEKLGDVLIGVLIDLRMEQITDNGQKKAVLAAIFELEDGSRVKLFPSHDLKEKIGQKRYIGRRLFVVYDANNAATANKGNSMKVFKVMVQPQRENGLSDFVPTDDDLPENLR